MRLFNGRVVDRVCKPCGRSEGWPIDSYTPISKGYCEVCGDHGDCFDVPSKNLSGPDPWAEIIPGEAAAIESIKAAMASKPNDKCLGCGTRPAGESARHEVDDMDCREMQFERAWKSKEDGNDHEDLDLLA